MNDFMTEHIITPKKVQLFNISPSQEESFFTILTQFLVTKMMGLLVIMLIFYRCHNDGLSAFIPILLSLFLIVMQDRYYKSTYLKVIFICVAILIGLKEI